MNLLTHFNKHISTGILITYNILSADMDSLYNSILVDEAINCIKKLISEYNVNTFNSNLNNIRTLLNLALQDNYFKFNNI